MRVFAADAGNRKQRIDEIERHVVAEEEPVVRVRRRVERDDHQDLRRLLLNRDAETVDRLWQLSSRLPDAVLHVDERFLNVRADLERAVERVLAARRARRLHVDEVVDADDLVFDLGCDRLLHDRSARADVRRLHLNQRRRDRRKLRDGKREDRDGTQDDDDDGKHHRKDRPGNEEVCHVI